MIAAHLEPKGLDRDAIPLGDFSRSGNRRAEAIEGSAMLRDAILNLAVPKIKRRPPKQTQTWAARKTAKAQVLRIRCEVAEYFGRSVADMLSKRGDGSLCLHRQIAMYLARECTTASYVDVGKQFGNRDHTTVIHSCQRVETRLKSDRAVRADVAVLRERLAA